MYVIMRRYAEIGASMYEIVARKAGKGAVPMLKGQPGFQCYGAFVSEDGDGISVTIFDSRERAILANEQVRGWARDNLRDLVLDPPEVLAGDCGVVEVAREQGAPQRQPPFITMWEFAGLGLLEPTGATVRRHILPSIVGSQGFRAVYMFRD